MILVEKAKKAQTKGSFLSTQIKTRKTKIVVRGQCNGQHLEWGDFMDILVVVENILTQNGTKCHFLPVPSIESKKQKLLFLETSSVHNPAKGWAQSFCG